MINGIRWPLIAILLLFNNLGFAEDPALVWPINMALLVALGLAAYVQVRLQRGHSFGRGITFALALIQDGLITAGVYLTGLYASHFYIFYYPSLLGFSLAFPLRTSLAYTTLVGAIYAGLVLFLTPGIGSDPLAFKVLVERLLVLYILVLIGWFLVRQERARRQEAVEAERRLALENADLLQALNQRMAQWQVAYREIEHTAGQSARLAHDLGGLADELESGRDEIEASVQELTERAMTYIDQVDAIARVADEVVGAAHDLVGKAGPTGSASGRAQEAVGRATETVRTLDDRSRAIGDLVAAVRQVADQTNLLAFNANIEAVQAGESGQRFAVVADEVRLVAERAIHLAREIDDLSAEIQHGTRRMLDAMAEIGGMVDHTVNLVQTTSQTYHDQQASADVMALSLGTLKDVARQNASDVRAIADAVRRQGMALQDVVALGQQLSESAGKLGGLTGGLVE